MEFGHWTLEKWGWKWCYYTRANKSESYKVYCRASYTGDDNVEFEWDGTAESPVLAGEFDGGYDPLLDSVQSFKGHLVTEGRFRGIPAV